MDIICSEFKLIFILLLLLLFLLLFEDKFFLILSIGLTPSQLQKTIESHTSPFLKQHNLGLMAHPSAIIATRSEKKHKALFFLDDLSCAKIYANTQVSVSGTVQPIHELMRQVCMLFILLWQI